MGPNNVNAAGSWSRQQAPPSRAHDNNIQQQPQDSFPARQGAYPTRATRYGGLGGAGNVRDHSADDVLLGSDDYDDYDDDPLERAEMARNSFYASPEDRVAQVRRMGPNAFSPDGTPMPPLA